MYLQIWLVVAGCRFKSKFFLKIWDRSSLQRLDLASSCYGGQDLTLFDSIDPVFQAFPLRASFHFHPSSSAFVLFFLCNWTFCCSHSTALYLFHRAFFPLPSFLFVSFTPIVPSLLSANQSALSVKSLLSCRHSIFVALACIYRSRSSSQRPALSSSQCRLTFLLCNQFFRTTFSSLQLHSFFPSFRFPLIDFFAAAVQSTCSCKQLRKRKAQ